MKLKRGTKVELVSTTDRWTNLKPGTQGTVVLVDAVGTIHVKWDDGHDLGLIPGEDVYKVLAGS